MFKRMVLAVTALILAPVALAAATDPFMGRWKLDVRHSRYPDGTCPVSMEIEMRPAEVGIWYHSDTRYKNGGEAHAQYTAGYDGKQAIVMGTRGLLLPVSLKRLNSRTVVASYSRGMLVLATSRRVVSDDGRVMTITTSSIDAAGKREVTLGLYRKE